jgi:lipopolysaccharide/colanic/teichoic acid biosynthesis glycosyltransferase
MCGRRPAIIGAPNELAFPVLGPCGGLVGPGPEALEVLQYHTPEEMIRFTCKPGITGLAQISGRKLLSWGETMALDLEYVRTRTIALDLKIILLTIKRVVTTHGAL